MTTLYAAVLRVRNAEGRVIGEVQLAPESEDRLAVEFHVETAANHVLYHDAVAFLRFLYVTQRGITISTEMRCHNNLTVWS